jgi:hypothetical protein
MTMGILITRALWFLFAMITAPLLAADVFFSIWKDKEGSAIEELAAAVRKITNFVRGDFYDSLVKGPILIFFLFLVGVLGKAIFSYGIADEAINGLSKSGSVQNLGAAFAGSLVVFFKFAVFFVLLRILFNRLDEFKPFKAEGGKRVVNWGRFASNLLLRGGTALRDRAKALPGRASRGATGLIGNALFGGVSALGTNTIGRAANLNSFKRFDNFSNRLSRSEGLITRNFGRLGQAITTGLKGATFDPRNSRVGGLVRSALDQTAAGKVISGGTAQTKGYNERVAAKAEAAKNKIDEDAKALGNKDNIAVTKEMQAEAEEKTSIKLGGKEMSLAQFKAMVADKDEDGSAFGAEFAKALDGARKGDPAILAQIEDSRKNAETKAKADESKRRTDERLKQAIEGSATGQTYSQAIGDFLTGNRGKVRSQVRMEFASRQTKGVKETTDKFGMLQTAKRDLLDALGQVKEAIEVPTNTSAQRTELRKLQTDLEKQILDLGIGNGKIEDPEKLDIVKKFSSNKQLQGDISKSKEKASEVLSSIYAESPENFDKFKQLSRARVRVEAQYQATPTNNIDARQKLKIRLDSLDSIIKGRKASFQDAQRLADKAKSYKENLEKNFGEKKEAPPATVTTK